MRGSFWSTSGFSTILALLLTGFLLTLSAGVLFLFLSESRTNQTLFNGTSAYHAAEWALEYAMLKIKNHREGFQDGLSMTATGSDSNATLFEWDRFAKDAWPRWSHLSYNISAVTNTYSGTIKPNTFEIIPLFTDSGVLLKTQADGAPWKRPDSTAHLVSLSEFLLRIDTGEQIVWNVIGNNAGGDTYGISGILGSDTARVEPNYSAEKIATGWSRGPDTAGKFRTFTGGLLDEWTKTISDFLTEYQECYLVLFNPNTQVARYSIQANTNFTLPKSTIIASGRVKDSVINLELSENKSKLFEIFKYSLFVGSGTSTP